MSERPGQKKIRRIAAGLILLMGLVLVQDRIRLLMEGYASLDWPTVAGEVVAAEASPIIDAKVGPGWRIGVNYQYAVDGTLHQNDRLRHDRRLRGMTREEAEQKLERFRPGQPVDVHYDPDRPSHSVLMAGPDQGAWFGLLVGLGMMAIALTFWIVPTRTSR